MYPLEHQDESQRLEIQNSQRLYNVHDELRNILFSKNEIVLDAGCGSGVISRYLKREYGLKKIIGVDGSDMRIAQAKNITEEEKIDIDYIVSNLDNTPFASGTFDKIICRFVFHHLTRPSLIMKELTRVLKKGGQLVIIDSDGILFNFYCANQFVMDCLDKLKLVLPFDLFAARKIKTLMNDSYINKDSEIIPMHFKEIDMANEIFQYSERFRFFMPELEKILGDNATKFVEGYLKALSEDTTELFYNKFIVTGEKK